MKHDRAGQSWFERFMRWAEGEEPERGEVPEDPERTEFLEYLEYIDAHSYIDFGAYRLMRYRERMEKGMPVEAPSHIHQSQRPQREDKGRPRYRPGRLRGQLRVYQMFSAAVAAVLVGLFFVVALQLPGFGEKDAPALNEVSQRYLEQGMEETGAVNAVTGLILDYRAFDTFGESTVLFAAAMSVVLLLRRLEGREREQASRDRILSQVGRLLLPVIGLFGVYVVVNGHLSPGGGFSGGAVLGAGAILAALVLGQERMDALLSPRRLTRLTVVSLLAYAAMKGYSFFTGANHTGWDVPKGTPGDILSAGFILPLNLCVGVIVACTMYTFYTLFAEEEA